MHTVHGTFKLKSGEIHFNLSTGKISGSVVADATSGESGSKGRDKDMHGDVLESEKFPEIVFTPTEVKGALTPGAASQVEVSGAFRLHGEEHRLTLNITVERTGEELRTTTQFSIPYVKWGLKNPSTFLLRVKDKVDIEVHAVGQLAPAAPIN